MPEPCGHVLLLHGAGGGGWEWVVWHRVLASRGWQVRAPDLLPTETGLAATTWLDYLRQVGAERDALPRRRVLIGASLGASLALHAATDVDALVLVNPLPPSPRVDDSDAPSLGTGGLVPWSREGRFAGSLRALPDDAVAARYAFSRWRDESVMVLRDALSIMLPPKPPMPVLVLIGGADADIPPAAMVSFARELGAEVRLLPGQNHLQPLLGRHAGVIATLAADWLDALSIAE